ncbi:MAG: hypothetical protein NC432_08735 [Roseburia sp.]|nr:hypothetical protein [Roseburia sp.]MCM1097801.1 hypothetical protein [Ruminococcus flavefaciens]
MSRILPVLFNTEMVQAILGGRKTVTRRIVKPQPIERIAYAVAGYQHGTWGYPDKNAWESWGEGFKQGENLTEEERKKRWVPPYQTGDTLYVRETWYYEHFYESEKEKSDLPSGRRSWRYVYKADEPDYPVIPGRWRPSIHMPKEAARLWLKVKRVRVERLQDMKFEDCLAEGAFVYLAADGSFNRDVVEPEAKRKFRQLWNSTIKKSDIALYGWDASPWVWVIEFERCGKPGSE